jgi:hypothetical protein
VVFRSELRAILEDAARGRFPAEDGAVRVLPSPPGRTDAVVAFTAHHVIAADVEHTDVIQRIPQGDLGAPLSASFLAWLGSRIGADPGSVDVVLAAEGTASTASVGPPPALRPVEKRDHDRVLRSERYRDGVETYVSAHGAIVTIGRGLAGRRELAIEVPADVRGRGIGRDAARAARALVPGDEVVFAQIAAGNASSLRAFLAAGFRPIGSEVLFLRPVR